MNERSLNQLHELKGNNETDGNDSVEKDEVLTIGNHSLSGSIV